MLEEQGKAREAARAMFRQGQEIFYARQYTEAAIRLRQAFSLAERLGDDRLGSRCEKLLRSAEFFVQPID